MMGFYTDLYMETIKKAALLVCPHYRRIIVKSCDYGNKVIVAFMVDEKRNYPYTWFKVPIQQFRENPLLIVELAKSREILFRKFTNITFEQQTGMRKYFDEHKIRTGRK